MIDPELEATHAVEVAAEAPRHAGLVSGLALVGFLCVDPMLLGTAIVCSLPGARWWYRGGPPIGDLDRVAIWLTLALAVLAQVALVRYAQGAPPHRARPDRVAAGRAVVAAWAVVTAVGLLLHWLHESDRRIRIDPVASWVRCMDQPDDIATWDTGRMECHDDGNGVIHPARDKAGHEANRRQYNVY